MAKRTIKTGVGTYVDRKGLHQFGLMGAEVDVHVDDLERFDRFNVGPAPEPEPEPANSADVFPEGAPEESWKVDELKAFADANGVDLGDATRKADILAALNAAQA